MKETIEVLIPAEDIAKRVKEIAEEISGDFQGEPITCVCILKGGVIFMTDIARSLNQTVLLDFMDVSSYGNSTESSGNIEITKDLDDPIEGKNVLIVEDIVDSGRTLHFLRNYLTEKNPKQIKICTLLDKPERRVVDVKCDYVGFDIPNEFVVGYGLDYAQKYRNLPYIGILRFE